MKQQQSLITKDGVSFLLPFILVTFCFALWGFANDITNPMVKAFSKIFRMSVTDGTLVQVAFYGGYFCMAFPAAIFIRKHSYKAGVMMGLGLYATGALLFFPRGHLRLLPYCLFHHDLRTVVPRDLMQPLYPDDGTRGDGYPKIEHGAVFQPLRFDYWHVCGDELHSGQTQSHE